MRFHLSGGNRLESPSQLVERTETRKIPSPTPSPRKEGVRLLSDLRMDWDIASSPPTPCRGKPRLVSYVVRFLMVLLVSRPGAASPDTGSGES